MFRSDESKCRRGSSHSKESIKQFEQLYDDISREEEISELETWQQHIIRQGFKRAMCIRKAFNNSDKATHICKNYTGRFVSLTR